MYVDLRLAHFLTVLAVVAAAAAGLGAGYHLWHKTGPTAATGSQGSASVVAADIETGLRSRGADDVTCVPVRNGTGSVVCRWTDSTGSIGATFTPLSASTMRADLTRTMTSNDGGTLTVPLGWTTISLATGEMGQIHASTVAAKVDADEAAKSTLREVIPPIESYYADNRSYAGVTLRGLKATYDQALDLSKYSLSGVTDTTYCVSTGSGAAAWHTNGPAEPMTAGLCP